MVVLSFHRLSSTHCSDVIGVLLDKDTHFGFESDEPWATAVLVDRSFLSLVYTCRTVACVWSVNAVGIRPGRRRRRRRQNRKAPAAQQRGAPTARRGVRVWRRQRILRRVACA